MSDAGWGDDVPWATPGTAWEDEPWGQTPFGDFKLRCTIVKVDRLNGTQANLRYTETAYRNYRDPVTGIPVPDGVYANTETWYPMACEGDVAGYSYVVTGKVRVGDLPKEDP